MSILFDCHKLTKTWTSSPIFTDVTFSAFSGDRIGIIGPNGAGKSTLLKIIAGEVGVDSGSVTKRKGLGIYYVEQLPRFPDHLTVNQLLEQLGEGSTTHTSSVKVRAQSLLMQAGLETFEQGISALSGGWQKRLALAVGFAYEPDLLLLDEPTNHLDLSGILWLESLLQKNRGAWVMATHDRALLTNTAQKIIEVNRIFPANTLLTEGNYDQHLIHRDQQLSALQGQQESLKNKLRREKEWLSRAPKARGTKAKYRIDQAYEIEAEVAEREVKSRSSRIDISFNITAGKSKELVKLEKICLSYGNHKILDNFSFTIQNKQTIGILGSNGSGKSTLLNLLTGKLKAQAGTLAVPGELRVVYFMQDRSILDPELTLKQIISPDSDSVKYRDHVVHYASWLRRFGFSAEQHHTKIGRLSGGEQARVLIALLMLQPADLLLLDEPTNDLDIQTLDALEVSLQEFSGATLIVSHDRYLLERLCSTYLGFVTNARGEKICLPFASIKQWQSYGEGSTKPTLASPPAVPANEPSHLPSKAGRKLSYLEQRQYDEMEETIAQAEQNLSKLHEEITTAAQHGDASTLQAKSLAAKELQEKIDTLYQRWDELETKKNMV